MWIIQQPGYATSPLGEHPDLRFEIACLVLEFEGKLSTGTPYFLDVANFTLLIFMVVSL